MPLIAEHHATLVWVYHVERERWSEPHYVHPTVLWSRHLPLPQVYVTAILPDRYPSAGEEFRLGYRVVGTAVTNEGRIVIPTDRVHNSVYWSASTDRGSATQCRTETGQHVCDLFGVQFGPTETVVYVFVTPDSTVAGELKVLSKPVH